MERKIPLNQFILGGYSFRCYCCLGIRRSPPMIDPIKILAPPSQSPKAVREELLRSLRERAVNHKFHYDSYKQAQKWLAVHNAYSPSPKDADCISTYEAAFASAAPRYSAKSICLVGLGCGGGQKDRQLIELLR